MTERFDSDLRFGRGPSPEEHPEVDQIARRLQEERPGPRSTFRRDLRRRLLERSDRQSSRPKRVRILVAAYAGSGAALLAIVALGVAGAGPLAPG